MPRYVIERTFVDGLHIPYDAPSPEAIRHAAERNGLPVNRISEVRVLDPFFYRP